MLQKTLHRKRHIPRLPDLHIAVAQQALALSSPGGRAVGEDKSYARMGLAQGLHQLLHRAGFAQRHRVYPHAARLRRQAVNTETLGDGLAVHRLASGPPQHAQEQHWHQRQHQGGVNQSRDAHTLWRSGAAASTCWQVRHTSSANGACSPPTACW